ncbi:exodeoxyribonuclease III [Nigerium massiliense]|uniref:exodeoxyribonuclease III n=1 Tax=Nigerium massiliense TaxID=1522317 RepID=UPI00058E5F25|nr:exodeoxyribonuclease III [Nigerium massiliense]
MRIATFNVNGIRAAHRRGFLRWLDARRPDVVALQEVRCDADAVPAEALGGYHLSYHPGNLAGRNGVGFLTTQAPTAIRQGFGNRRFDAEGRYIEIDLDLPTGPPLTLGSLYLPKGASPFDDNPDLTRYRRKMSFMASLRAYLTRARRDAQRAGREFAVMGDFNVAHARQDLKNWRGAGRTEGFLPEEREWFGTLLSARTLTDVVRSLHPDEDGPYSWWSWMPGAFDRNTGWRIDYQLVTPGLARAAVAAGTDRDATAEARISDHAPVVVDYDFG